MCFNILYLVGVMTKVVYQSVYSVITHQTAQKPRMKVVVRIRICFAIDSFTFRFSNKFL